MEAQFDVFLSHNSRDKPTVRQLAEALQRRGLKVWLDEWELVPGRPWQEALEEIIQTTRSAAVLVGKDGLGPWEIPEMRGCLSEFVGRKLPVIPVLLPDAPSQPKLPLFLTGFTWVDLRAAGLSETNLDRLEWGITGCKPVPKPVVDLRPEPPPGPVKEQEIPITPPKGSKTKRNWLLGLTGLALVVLIGVVSTIPILPPKNPSTTNTTLPPPGEEFQDKLNDGTLGPKMRVIPAGTFLMGSPDGETGRDKEDEKQHQVDIDKAFAIGKYEVTVGQFKKFVEMTNYQTEAEEANGCYSWTGSEWKQDISKSWKNPGFLQDDSYPVVCGSWNDAMAYVDWLSGQTGEKYRLPTEAEWEYAARAGTTTARYWGDDPDKGCAFANGADQTLKKEFKWTNSSVMDCQDGYAYTAPVGKFKPNAFGLYDMLGNVWEWTCSEYKTVYSGAEKDCIADKNSNNLRVLRGGSWYTVPKWLRGAARGWHFPHDRSDYRGFRLARD
ncbi:MAG: SUMF1/EgtB/PvdO family nonheme iron enzyme [Candidatus Competibacteraceae bacterium]